MKINARIRIKAVKEYIKGKKMASVAAKYNVHINTLSRWYRLYETGGIDRLTPLVYNKPWNRSSREREVQVMMVKENNPSITIRKARALLSQRGLNISLKGIYGIWKRYNLVKRPIEDPTSPFSTETVEVKSILKKARALINKKRNKDNKDNEKNLIEAAMLLNQMPSYPREKEPLIKRIPDKLLSPRRRLDKLYLQFLKIPMPRFAKAMKAVRQRLEKDGLYYSSVIAGLNEALALHWMRWPVEELKLHALLRQRVGKMRDPVLNFELSFMPAAAYVEIGDMKNARAQIRKIRRMLRMLPYASFHESYGDLMTFVGDYKTAQKYHSKALRLRREKSDRVRLLTKLNLNHVISGEYIDALRVSAMLDIKPDNEYYLDYTACQGFMCYGLGRFEKALFYVKETLDRAEKEQFRNALYSAVIVLTSIARALEKFKEAENMLKKYLRLVDKYKLVREGTLLRFFLKGELPVRSLLKFPVFKLTHFLKNACVSMKVKDYRRAYAYAYSKGLMGFLHRFVVFSPEIILNLLRKGYKTYLPNTILSFPVFNREVPVYNVKFLGPLIVYRNQQRLRTKLTPKEEALLIFISLKLNEPGKSVPVKELHDNFWPRSVNPPSQLSHHLVQLKSKLSMPRHLVSISGQFGERHILNKGFYIATDYQDFEINVAEARALERAGELAYARGKYLQALRLLRDEPFLKMYDNWSENTRTLILNQCESAVSSYLKVCDSLRNRRETERVVNRLKLIIPRSDVLKTGFATTQ